MAEQGGFDVLRWLYFVMPHLAIVLGVLVVRWFSHGWPF